MQFTVTENAALTKDVYRMTLSGDTRAFTKPGQFVQVQVPGFYLRRPLSVYDWQEGENGSVTVVYKTVGHGTEAMSLIPRGAQVDLLTGLGNGFAPEKPCKRPLLLGGGVGVPPLYGLCKQLLLLGKTPTAVLGFNTESEIILQKDFEALGIPVAVATVDGSAGSRGFVTDASEPFAAEADYVYACGPMPMLKAVNAFCEKHGLAGEFSFEERMGCGFGACMGCSLQTKNGSKRVCKEGPVFGREEIVW